MSVSSSSWGLGRAAVCDCGTPWTFLSPFFQLQHAPSAIIAEANTFCTQFALFQKKKKRRKRKVREKSRGCHNHKPQPFSINEPTHFTETSSSLLDILLVSNNFHLIVSGVGDPFLNQEHRYHCPIVGIYNFSKPKSKSFARHIWKYDQGDYNLLKLHLLTGNP